MTNKKLVFVFESVNIKSGAGSGEMEPKKKSVEWMAFELSRIVSRQSRSCSSAKAIVHEAIAGLKECATGSGQSTVFLEAILRGEEEEGNFGRPKKKIGIAVGSQGVRVGLAFALQLASFAEFVELRGGMEKIEPETIAVVIEDKLGLICAFAVATSHDLQSLISTVRKFVVTAFFAAEMQTKIETSEFSRCSIWVPIIRAVDGKVFSSVEIEEISSTTTSTVHSGIDSTALRRKLEELSRGQQIEVVDIGPTQTFGELFFSTDIFFITHRLRFGNVIHPQTIEETNQTIGKEIEMIIGRKISLDIPFTIEGFTKKDQNRLFTRLILKKKVFSPLSSHNLKHPFLLKKK